MLQGNLTEQPDVSEAVAARVQRQAILYDQARRFEFLITEGALRWRPGPSDVMQPQLAHLATVATLPNVQLGIIPLDVEAPDAYLHQFVVFEMPDETIVSIETYSAELVVSDPAEVEVYALTLQRLRSVAQWGAGAFRPLG
jgi:hypothetical protein